MFVGDEKLGGYIYDLGFDASTSLHEYGFDWSEDSVTWYVDGEAVYTVTSDEFPIPNIESRIMMNVWNGVPETTSSWIGTYDGTVPLTAKYDYISYVAEDTSVVDVPVTFEKDSYVTATLPEEVLGENTTNVDFEYSISGDIKSNEEVSITVVDADDDIDGAQIELEDTGGNIKYATVTLDKTTYGSTEVTAEGTTSKGVITCDDLSAGSWLGDMVFVIDLVETTD